jgi:hypothetical protein
MISREVRLLWIDEVLDFVNDLVPKSMYNDREDMSSLIPPHQLEKILDISNTMHYLLQPSLAIIMNN